jgi:cytochrome oxidase assembly protein ShyY1
VPDAKTASPVTPAGHRLYAATWFSLAAIALIIYGFALRKRLKERSVKP